MRGLLLVVLFLGLQARIRAQSIEPEPGVVEQGGVVEIRAWTAAAAPLVALQIGLRRVDDDGSAGEDLIGRCSTDERGIARLQVDGPPGRYRLEAEVDGVAVRSPFRVVAPAPRLAWAASGAVVLLAAGLWMALRRAGDRRRAEAGAD